MYCPLEGVFMLTTRPLNTLPCCDFCDTPQEISEHIQRLQDTYGKDAEGKLIVPPQGWTVLPFGADIPSVHREWSLNSKWHAFPRQCRSTMTPLFAKPSGHVRAYAVPI